MNLTNLVGSSLRGAIVDVAAIPVAAAGVDRAVGIHGFSLKKMAPLFLLRGSVKPFPRVLATGYLNKFVLGILIIISQSYHKSLEHLILYLSPPTYVDLHLTKRPNVYTKYLGLHEHNINVMYMYTCNFRTP
jgi:hypothetical protein